MKKLFPSITFLLIFCLNAFSQDYEESILSFQNELNEEYRNPEESPLTKKDRKKFNGLDFYPIDEKYKVIANFERVENAIPFQMKTTTDRLPTYEIYGVATFTFDGKEYALNVYQSHRLREMEKYKDHLFLPFTDPTNSVETYGGGRYLDLTIPEGDQIVIDFNKAYNPYCAYNPVYSCPIPPKENDLDFEVMAGVRYERKNLTIASPLIKTQLQTKT